MRLKIKKLLVVAFGTFLIAVSLDLFLAPAGIAPGGLSGLSVVLNHLIGVPIGLLILILNIPVLLWGLKHFSRKFMYLSLLGMLLLSLFTDAFSFLAPITSDILLSAIYGGFFMGLGTGLVFSVGGTTGGTDIAAGILKKRFPSVSVGKFVLIIDTFVIGFAGLVFGKWETVLYSAASLYISTVLIDLITEGGDAAKLAYVISDKQEAIAQKIFSQLERGTTVLHGSSFYSGAEKSVLMCVVKKYEISKLKAIIRQTDVAAFVVVSDAREVLGNGFKQTE